MNVQELISLLQYYPSETEVKIEQAAMFWCTVPIKEIEGPTDTYQYVQLRADLS